MKNLAIVIPAYKNEFFRYTLDSLACQTNKDFIVYIGDDASNDYFMPIINEYSDKIDIVYKRFDDNMGGYDLVAQWERCINLTNKEPWIWLFSDDDCMGPNCVQLFYEEVVNNVNFDIYHFNTSIIDKNNNIIRTTSPFPSIMSVKELYKRKESARIDSFVVEYVFSREIYEKVRGFQKFDLAWGSDTATWIKMGQYKGIKTIEGDRVYWRSSDLNITPNLKNSVVFRKFKISLTYFAWAHNFFNDKEISLKNVIYFYRLLFHYSLLLDRIQLKEIIKAAYNESIISFFYKTVFENSIYLTKLLKNIKQIFS